MIKMSEISHLYIHSETQFFSASLIQFEQVTFEYSVSPVPVIKNLDMVFPANETGGRFIVLVGPSGCGKSTLLRLLAGLLTPTSGRICVLGQPVLSPSGKRGMVFQNYTCFDWLTVLENVRFPLELKQIRKEEANSLAMEYLRMVGLEDYASFHPKHLSGGMRQRVAIARSLINSPDLLLMDEPFGALDHFTREDMQENLLKIWRRVKNNIVFVTHEITEAIYLADEICVMSSAPMEVFARHQIQFPIEARQRGLKYDLTFIEYVKLIQEQIRKITIQRQNRVDEAASEITLP
jgi:ABC-type nitrate/sulfonate/bicarbonate transport system ATPase subunit